MHDLTDLGSDSVSKNIFEEFFTVLDRGHVNV